MTTARAHMIVRRKAKDGSQGNPGATPRFSTYTAGVAYMSGSNGERFYDVVFHVGYQQFFRCVQSYPASETHAPSQSSSNAYWEWQQGLESLIVNCLCANNAFLNNLYVRHLNAADGIFTGGFRIPFVTLADANLIYMYRDSTSKPGTGGDFYWYHYQLKSDSASYIDLSEHVVYYDECVVIHVPYNSALDGRRFAFAFPYRPHGYDLGGAFSISVPSGGAIYSDAIQLENRYDMDFTSKTSRGFFNGGVVEILIQMKDNAPIVYITSGDVPDLYNKPYAPWSQ